VVIGGQPMGERETMNLAEHVFWFDEAGRVETDRVTVSGG
jgi:hypothetical protein